jgi:hypothetical protein
MLMAKELYLRKIVAKGLTRFDLVGEFPALLCSATPLLSFATGELVTLELRSTILSEIVSPPS